MSEKKPEIDSIKDLAGKWLLITIVWVFILTTVNTLTNLIDFPFEDIVQYLAIGLFAWPAVTLFKILNVISDKLDEKSN